MSLTLILLSALLADPPAPSITYYLGESKVATPDGKPLGNMASLVKRELVPAESKIVETVMRISSRPGEPIKEYVTVFAVKGDAFTMKERGGAFSGDGHLVGKPWAWTAWDSTSRIPGPNGMTVVSRDKLTDRGMTASKEVLGPDGTPRVTMAEVYATIDGATYELFRSKLAPREILQPKAPPR